MQTQPRSENFWTKPGYVGHDLPSAVESDLIDEQGHVDKAEVGRRVKSAIAVVVALVVLVGGGWFTAKQGYQAYLDFRQKSDYIGEGKDDTSVIIPSGASISQMATILADRDIVKTATAFREAAATA